MAVSPFSGVVGHQRVLDLLAEEARRPAQAYLFVGPGSVGKGTVARRFAAALLCPEGGRHQMADCSHCRRVVAGVHPDLVLVEPEGKTVLSVDQARATVARATLAPVEGERKIFLLEEGGSLSEEAANALLKTLEEPTASTVFILVAEAEDQLPPTVASRCRTVFFGRVGEEELVEALAGLGVERDQAAQAAAMAGGRPGLAMGLATRPEVAAFRRTWLSVPLRVSARPGEAIRLAEEVLEGSAPLLGALEERQGEEMGRLQDEGADQAVLKAVRDRHHRETRRGQQALLVTGLELLASWYRDAAAAQFGGPVRNRDVPSTALAMLSPAAAVAKADRTLQAVEAVLGHQRPPLVLAALFADLGTLD